MEKSEGRIRIDLNGNVIPQKVLAEAETGCLETIEKLGELGKAIKFFEISFIQHAGYNEPGPVLKVHFKGVGGINFSYVIDYRYIGSDDGTGKTDPTSQQIVETLCAKRALPLAIMMHLERSKL
jgi:hypothetical protein